ncbi:Ap4A phosphorylase II [Beauveria bassiana ARSEF 2860]|uniref:Ap4A phosphorylase II n=1 Tax=Beauveria bassiana (strain ARSEF 2860) TaxID=655819 RepID=J4UNQ1_BEAB2|nr:Ap4A phosphorylase II [Beauveria bassiana ARSEF 2860]EJP66722.1 Ap4A phosphorylase II [Beauveria bassiana ARSEF 2860]
MATLKVPARLPELIKVTFAKALSNGDLFYFATHAQDVRVGALTFQLRFSPALANKPKAPPTKRETAETTPSKPFDPFAYTTPPPPPLFVGDVGAAHFLVLNKFAIVPGHFILATRVYKPQTDVLEADDLHATLACLRAYQEAASPAPLSSSSSSGGGDDDDDDGDGEDGALFAFFNCGEHSGASQPHRHIQMLPVAAMREGLPADSAWRVLATQLNGGGGGGGGVAAPFTTFSQRITLDTSQEELHAAYLRLYAQAVRAVKGEESEVSTTGEAAISYNLAMTRDRLVLCPRRAEGDAVRDPDTGHVVGKVSLNGTMLAGTALVKTEAEWEALRKNPRALTTVLKSVGIPQLDFVEESNKL